MQEDLWRQYMSESNRLSGLKAKSKISTPESVQSIDRLGDSMGFLDRTPRKKPGRKPSPRTYQLHPKVMPDVGLSISSEAEKEGITQGMLIEKIWKIYKDLESL